jgi:hypothetical protein
VQDDALLEKMLGERLYMAHLEIATALKLEDSGQGFPSIANFEQKIPSTADYEYPERVLDMIYKLKAYRKAMPEAHFRLVTDICCNRYTIRQWARDNRQPRTVVGEQLKWALMQWVGEKKKNTEKRTKKERKPVEMNISKIVYFVNEPD